MLDKVIILYVVLSFFEGCKIMAFWQYVGMRFIVFASAAHVAVLCCSVIKVCACADILRARVCIYVYNHEKYVQRMIHTYTYNPPVRTLARARTNRHTQTHSRATHASNG